MTTYSLPFSVIACSGADAQHFLHNQLTQSVNDLDSGHARLFAYCTPKGRVIANGLIWRSADNDGFYLLVHQSIAEALLHRLKMYVLRAQVTLELVHDAMVLGSQQPLIAAPSSVPTQTELGQLPIYTHQAGICIQALTPPHEPPRYWHIMLHAHDSQPPSKKEQLIPLDHWLYQELRNGWVWIKAETAELFIPQNINLDIIPAVHFAKGCFPGQEVVARSHYRTTIRKRTVLMSAPVTGDNIPTAASSLLAQDLVLASSNHHAAQPARVAGRIADCVIFAEQVWALVETQLDYILEQHKLELNDELCFEHIALPFEDRLPWEKK